MGKKINALKKSAFLLFSYFVVENVSNKFNINLFIAITIKVWTSF